MIAAKLVAHSASKRTGKEIKTWDLEYPRFIHAELMTHRLFSRNASSSRAIPVMKQIRRIIKDPAMPIHWGSNRPGMQATEELTGWRRWLAIKLWLLLRWPAIAVALIAIWIGLHKQVANRLLEPWMHIRVVLTATEFGNWYNLRYHPAAQPEIQELARVMWEAEQLSIPEFLDDGEWHLPFVTVEDRLAGHDIATLLRIATARAARVSYLNHEGKKPTLQEDLDLFKRLLADTPKHASPSEHQATPLPSPWMQSGNFWGWLQFRKTIDGEYMPEFKGPKT